MANASTTGDPSLPRFLKYPYIVAGTGVPVTTTGDDHMRDLILQVLFTIPGERVNLPEFGVGIQKLLFEPSSDALRSTAQFLASTNLRRWLGDRINVEQAIVSSAVGEEEVVTIEIVYTVLQNNQRGTITVQL